MMLFKFLNIRFRLLATIVITKRFVNTSLKKTKETSFVSYSLSTNKRNGRFTFDILADSIKLKGTEYNLIKKKEIQNKILLHLRELNVNEGLAILVLCSKYHLLDFSISKEVINFLFEHSFFLNSKHLYIFVLLIKRNYFENEKCFLNDTEEEKEKDTYEKECIEENLKWKKTFYEHIKKDLCVPLEKERENKSLSCVNNKDNINDQLDFLTEQNNYNVTSYLENGIKQKVKILSEQVEPELQEHFCDQSSREEELKECQAKIKNILFHNYNNIQFYLKHNLFCSLYLLNYLLEENILSLEVFANSIYTINDELDSIIFDYKKENIVKREGDRASNVIDSFIEEEEKKNSLVDLYVSTHFNLIKKMFQKNIYINDDHILEKIEYNVSLETEIYKHKKMYIDIFHLFFNFCLKLKGEILFLKLFYMNVVVYNILKLLVDEMTDENIKIYYDFLKNVKLDIILRKDQEPNFNYFLLSIIFYLKRKSENKNIYQIRLFEKEINELYKAYTFFLNSLQNYSLYEILMISDDIKRKGHHRNSEEQMMSDSFSISCDASQDFFFFSFFIVEITFNLLHYMKKMDAYTLVTIFKYLGNLHFINEFVIDIWREYLFHFFFKRSFYKNNDSKKYFFYFIEYLLAELYFSSSHFLYLLQFIDISSFRSIFASIPKEETFERVSKKLYDCINSLINKKEKQYQKENLKKVHIKNMEKKCSESLNHVEIWKVEDKLQKMQNVLYDFLFF